jgi:hypothetical protein
LFAAFEHPQVPIMRARNKCVVKSSFFAAAAAADDDDDDDDLDDGDK